MVPTRFGLRPSIGILQLNLVKIILILKHSVRLRRNLLCGGVAAYPSMACVFYAGMDVPSIPAYQTVTYIE